MAFTIFATVGAEAGAVSGDSAQGMEEGLHEESAGMATDGAGLYDDPAEMQDLNEPNPDNFEDFDLDLSEADGPNSESWDIGATLTGDLSDTASARQDDSMNHPDLGSGEFEVQGLGFDLTGGSEQEETEVSNEETNSSPEDEFNTFADETAAPEMQPLAGQNEIPFESKEDDSTHQDKVGDIPLELPGQEESMEPNDTSAQDPEQGLDVELSEFSLETELDLGEMESETMQKSEVPDGPKDPAMEMSPTLELEKLQLDLETPSMESEPIQATPPSNSEVPLESLELKMDSGKDEKNNPSMPDEESTPDR